MCAKLLLSSWCVFCFTFKNQSLKLLHPFRHFWTKKIPEIKEVMILETLCIAPPAGPTTIQKMNELSQIKINWITYFRKKTFKVKVWDLGTVSEKYWIPFTSLPQRKQLNTELSAELSTDLSAERIPRMFFFLLIFLEVLLFGTLKLVMLPISLAI